MNSKICKELINNQLSDIDKNLKMSLRDIIRLSKHLDKSIFDENECSIWKGYITHNRLNDYGSPYINFYFKNKKVNLHRLLYINFKGPLQKNEYIKFICDNRGTCCNINHLIKFKYSSKANNFSKILNKEKKKELCDNHRDIIITNSIYTLNFE